MKVWLITGASRGLGLDIAKAALAAGDTVIATGRNAKTVSEAIGASDRLLALSLDVTAPGAAESAVDAAVKRFGRIDVLVNNAGYALIGAIEECSTEELTTQFQTNVMGLWAVTRAVLPVLRKQKSGHIFNVSSIAGFISGPGGGAYCATKHAVEAISESLRNEVAPLGIKVTVVEPGYFRTDFASNDSMVLAKTVIADYEAAAGQTRLGSKGVHGAQAGDPAKLAQAFVTLANAEAPPFRFLAGADAVKVFEIAMNARGADVEAWRALSTSLAHD